MARAGELLPLAPGQVARPWQTAAMEALFEGLRTWRSVLVSAATGTGKGTLIASLIVRAARRGSRVLFLVHRDELIEDVMRRAYQIEPALQAGKVQGDRNELAAQVVCASVQSLHARRLQGLAGRLDLVITDEAHHAEAASYRRIYDHARTLNPKIAHIGFTATPFRNAGEGRTEGLGNIFEALVYEYGLSQAIQDGVLAPLECVQIETDLDLSGLDPEDEAQLSRVIDTPERNRLAVTKYREHLQGKPAIVFGVSVAHARALADAFCDAGIVARAVWGEMPRAAREAALSGYKSGEIAVLCNKDLLTEGFDAPRTVGVLLLRPTGSRGLFAQMVGRCTRLCSGKEAGIVLDFAANSSTHDLASLSDLTAPEEREEETTTLSPGDRVRLRARKASRGEGLVVTVQAGTVPRVEVEWLTDGATTWHTPRELARLRKGGAQEELFRVTPRVAGAREFRVTLFGEGRRAGGWYEYLDTKKRRRLTLTSSGADRVTVQLIETETGWEIWVVEPGRVQRIDAQPVTLEVAQTLGAAQLARLEVKPLDFRAGWLKEPASEKQLNALKKWRIRHSPQGLSKGEASLLLETAIARARIDERRNCAE